jgi:glycosyltransferase involved in cell wall biosynthesis
MRILHIIGSMRLGGAQTCLKYLVERNQNPDIEQFVYPLRPRPVEIALQAKVIQYNYPNYDPRKFWAILRICNDYDIDIIHAHLHKPILGALLATYFCDVRVVVHEHGPIFRPGIQYGAYRRLLRRLHHRASRFIANSQATARQLQKVANVDPQEIEVIYNTVDLETFQPNEAARNRLRREYHFTDDDIILGYAGRLHEVKGVDLLIEAMAILLKKSPHYRLLLLGHGPDQPALEKQTQQLGIQQHVQFLGFRRDVAEFMNAFDIGVVPSRQEPFGIVALEFMRAKVPLVCSDADGLAEFVRHEENALVPSPNTPENIADCIERLALDPDLAQKISDTAYQCTEAFGVENQIQALERVYREVLTGRNPSESA